MAHTAFSKGSKDRGYSKFYSLYVSIFLCLNWDNLSVAPIRLRQQKASFILGATLSIPSYERLEDPELLCGLPSNLIAIPPVAAIEGYDADGPWSEIVVPDSFPPGSVLVFATSMTDLKPELEGICRTGAAEAFNDLDLVDLNVLIHREDGEEKDSTGMNHSYFLVNSDTDK